VSGSLFWYDFETTGADPRRDRPLQVAGVRTDESLREIEAPLELFCQPSDDILPHPQACLITGIGPEVLAEKGMREAEFVERLHAELIRPQTCVVGYNSLRFDDEVTRHALYRNFHDPYAREWQGGNSRWDLIDSVRTAYALRPEGIEWPMEEGRVTLRLERLTEANGIDHGKAHDALADVRATIALARLLKDRQPKLYNYLFELRNKRRVSDQIRLLEPMVHVSGRYGAQRGYLALVLPLAWHPKNRNALIVCDLQGDCEGLCRIAAEDLRARLYTRRDELPEGVLPVPLKLLHINKCPVVAPLSVLRDADRERLGIDRQACLEQAQLLREQTELWQEKLQHIYAADDFDEAGDPEQALYQGFIGDADRRLCQAVLRCAPDELASRTWAFEDARLPELLFRYRARNYPESLSAEEHQRWLAFCRRRLVDSSAGAPLTLEAFEQAMQLTLEGAGADQIKLLQRWQSYAGELRQRVALIEQ